jgi:UDP-N-acetylglucosamine 2-epimerase (non-hydrolysing)
MNILVIFGTRPEAIKLFPVVHALQHNPDFDVRVCVTAQHREMLDQVMAIARIKPDFDLNLMQPGQTLPDLTQRIVGALTSLISQHRPDRIMVQGDTTTAMAAALTAYYHKIPVDHVEAGLRSGNIYSPWPEEVNRKIIGAIASLHFAPTRRAADALIHENVPRERIVVTGNTVIDALHETRARLDQFSECREAIDAELGEFRSDRKIVLVTAHRRENFNGGMQSIATALRRLAEREDVLVVYPIHRNPNVIEPMQAILGHHPRIRLLDPLEYVPFIYLLSICHVVLTDSGGVQEEAPAFGKPVLVMRDTTERQEGIDSGTALLVGTDTERIWTEACRLLDDDGHYQRMARAHNPYGDGQASRRIADALVQEAERCVGIAA